MAISSFFGKGNAALAVFILVVLSAALVVPVSAATKYLGGEPVLSATVTGINEFMPGDDATISVLVQNSGVNTMKQLNQGTIEYEDLPTTAKFVTAGLSSESDAIIIKSDPQYVGDILSGSNGVTLQFKAKISTNATIGEYQLPLIFDYKYPDVLRQEKADVFEYTYITAHKTVPLTVRIKPEVKIAVVEAIPDVMSAGTEGYLNLKIRNDGSENGTKASVKLIRSGSSAIIPTDSTAFIGNFPSGGIAGCKFKISASKDATAQVYPVDVQVTYMDSEGNVQTSKTETIGIPVNDKISFSLVSSVPSVAAGSHDVIEVQYRNNGNSTVYETQARMTPHGDVTVNGDTIFLGEIRPGESATARYEITVGRDIEPSTYTFDSKLRFRDALGNSQESDTVAIPMKVTLAKTGSVAGIPTTILAIIVLGVIAVGIGLFLYRRRKSMQ
jgi:LPXTG-motif cell wall-anchored protein